MRVPLVSWILKLVNPLFIEMNTLKTGREPALVLMKSALRRCLASVGTSRIDTLAPVAQKWTSRKAEGAGRVK